MDLRTDAVLDLLDWKRQVFGLYAAVRAEADPEAAHAVWRSERDRLFRDHPQSPIPDRPAFDGLAVYDYDRSMRVLARVEDALHERLDIGTSGSEPMSFTRFAVARFTLAGKERALDLYWLDAYGGGLFLPFRDETSGSETYGAGRYLLDTVKGADLGTQDGLLVLDFNFAYNPSCSYDPRWVCPLAPPANRLAVAVRAGERQP